MSPDVKVKRQLELQKNNSRRREIANVKENADGETKSSINTNVSGEQSVCVSELPWKRSRAQQGKWSKLCCGIFTH